MTEHGHRSLSTPSQETEGVQLQLLAPVTRLIPVATGAIPQHQRYEVLEVRVGCSVVGPESPPVPQPGNHAVVAAAPGQAGQRFLDRCPHAVCILAGEDRQDGVLGHPRQRRAAVLQVADRGQLREPGGPGYCCAPPPGYPMRGRLHLPVPFAPQGSLDYVR